MCHLGFIEGEDKTIFDFMTNLSCPSILTHHLLFLEGGIEAVLDLEVREEKEDLPPFNG